MNEAGRRAVAILLQRGAADLIQLVEKVRTEEASQSCYRGVANVIQLTTGRVNQR